MQSSVILLSENKMTAVLKLLLLAAVTLLVSALKWNNYESLPDSYKLHIDKALEKASKSFGDPHHIAFEKILSEPKISETEWYINVRLVVSGCRKDPKKGHGHRTECVDRKPKTPWINCVVCTKQNKEELIDCARQIDIKSRDQIRDECSHKQLYRLGGGNLLAQTDENKEQQIGCLGCV